MNFLDLDDILVADEGELVDPRSVIALPIDNERPLLPRFERSSNDPFLRQLNASEKSGSSSSILRVDHRSCWTRTIFYAIRSSVPRRMI